jgi:prepilin-type N-terminal cleavage/methylation domain-containing protein
MRRGFTILEMLVATALTAVLLAAVFQVIGSLGRSRAALARQADNSAWKSDLLETLRRDLINSIAVSFRANGITLSGHSALQQNTLACDHLPVTVNYGLVNIHGRSWLVRTQAPRGGLSNESGWTELVCPDVSTFTVKSASLISPVGVEGAVVPPVVSVVVDGPGGGMISDTLVVR